jgi:proteasome lid subunit RPN8/RPN11
MKNNIGRYTHRMNETCWTLIGEYDPFEELWRLEILHKVDGQSCSVEADWQWTLEREEQFGDVIGFCHTHPVAVGGAPSERDIRTMQAWCSALGKPLLCVIAIESLSGDIAAYLFDDDEDAGRPVGKSIQVETGQLIVYD